MENVVTVGRVVPDTYFYPRKNGKKLFAIAKNILNQWISQYLGYQ